MYETTTSIPVDDLIVQLVTINNLRLKVDRLAVSLEDLAAKGPQKPESLRGLSNPEEYLKYDDLTVINGLKEMPPRVGTREVTDETYH